jgi:hypothetical protein
MTPVDSCQATHLRPYCASKSCIALHNIQDTRTYVPIIGGESEAHYCAVMTVKYVRAAVTDLLDKKSDESESESKCEVCQS